MLYLKNMEFIMSLLCCIIYPILIYILYYWIRYDVDKDDKKMSFYILLMPIYLLITPTISTEYSHLTNIIRAINPYMLIFIGILYFIVLLKYIYLKFKNKDK